MIRKTIDLTYKAARRLVVALVGVTVLLLGVIMLVAPGPGLVVIPIGLAILSIEFAWARHWLRKVRESISTMNHGSRANAAERHRSRVTGNQEGR